MKRVAIGGGAYQSADGRYWARPWINRRRTWRLLVDDNNKPLTTRRAAIAKASNHNWQPRGDNFQALAQLYLDSGCLNKKLEKRTKEFLADETVRVAHLIQYFGRLPVNEIKLPLLPKYAAWRKPRARYGTGERTVDRDLCTLSNVLNYGIAIGQIEINWIRNNRPHYRKDADVRHSRTRMPESAETIHQITEYFFGHPLSEVMGWLTLFAMFTGCRTSELLRLRTDAEDETQAGYIKQLPPDHPAFIPPLRLDRGEGRDEVSTIQQPPTLGYLYLGRRSKNGLNPWSIIGPEFAEMIRSYQYWKQTRYAKSPWYFPGQFGNLPLTRGTHTRALARACENLKLPNITPHGERAYYVTKRRRDGARDSDVAAEIGDKTVSLISTTYGDHAGGDKLHWAPKEKLPAWLIWRPPGQKITRLKTNRRP